MDSLFNVVQSTSAVVIGKSFANCSDSGLFILGGGPVCLVAPPGPVYYQVGLYKTDESFNSAFCFGNGFPYSITDLVKDTVQIFLLDSNINFSRVNYLIQAGGGTVDCYYNCVPGTGGVTVNVEKAISLYPNPSNGLVSVVNIPEESIISVFDSFGKKIDLQFHQNQTDFSKCSAGIYLITIINRNTLTTLRLIKE
jgi:hypothetical protein